MPDILSLTSAELAAFLTTLGEKPFRSTQIFEWIYKKGALSYGAMSSLSKELRQQLNQQLPFPFLQEIERCVSTDGTAKFLWGLSDHEMIETVFIPTEKRTTLCISSQAGCKFGCRFCASGIGGWKRNLTTGEIIAQVLQVSAVMAPPSVTHIVFMGVGEPFDNYDNVMKAVRLLNGPDGFNIAARRITLSTCGVVPGIERFAKEGLQVELSVSLHAPNDELRSCLMPVNKKYPLKQLMSVCRRYAQETHRQVTFEYILIKELTSTSSAARELSRLMKGWLSKVNLIPCNPVKEFAYEPPSREEVLRFKSDLEAQGVICTLRTPRGRDVSAACGQLRHAANISPLAGG